MSALEHGLRVGGHPLHVILVHFPIGLCIGAAALDVGYLILGNPELQVAAKWVLLLGVLSLGPAVVAGFIDYVSVMRRADGEVKTIANRHLLVAGLGATAFVGSWLLRTTGADEAVYATLAIVGAAFFGAAGRLGGRMVLEFGIGSAPQQTDDPADS